MKILFKVTSRSRPAQLIRTLDNILEMTISKDFEFLVTLDQNDTDTNSLQWISKLEALCSGCYYFGTSKNKVNAINRDMEWVPDWDILVNVSDDQVFTKFGFDETIRANMPADLDAFLHFRDTNHNPPDALCTLSILGRKYFERDGYIYHPSYVSVWCDNEAMEVAKQRGKYKYIPDVVFQHLHPAYGKAEFDNQYKKTESKHVHLIDKNNFLKRQRRNFPA